MRRTGPLVRVLCFHDVDDAVWFESVISTLVENYEVITPQQFQANDFDPEKIHILLSFDDGYQSWVDTCLPVLERYNCKGLFFINSGLLDSAPDEVKVATYMQKRLLITPKIALSWEGARSLLIQGHTIGGHTVNHPSLGKVELSAAQTEILQDKNKIEKELGIILTDFAYPFGTKKDFSADTQRAVRFSAGYTSQYSALTGFVRTTNAKKIIPRTLVEKNFPPHKLHQWIMGGYDIFRFPKN